MNDIKKEFFTSRISKGEETVESTTIFNILPEYGNGKIIIYNIIPGMYLAFNDLVFKKVIINKTNSRFPNPIIKIDYCIDGTYTSNCKCNNVCVVNKGCSAYYVGTDNFMDVDFNGKKYKSINLFCYLNEITDSIEQLLGVSKEQINEYFEKLNNRNNYLVIETDIEILHIINEIRKYIKCSNIPMVKIRAIELFLLEINNYRKYNSRKKKYYRRSTIDKIYSIKNYIEENMQQHITIDNLSSQFDISATELKDCFKHVNGMGPYTHLKNYRMQRACKLLSNADYNILEIANMVGYSNPSKFSATFKKTYGVTPMKYKKSSAF